MMTMIQVLGGSIVNAEPEPEVEVEVEREVEVEVEAEEVEKQKKNVKQKSHIVIGKVILVSLPNTKRPQYRWIVKKR